MLHEDKKKVSKILQSFCYTDLQKKKTTYFKEFLS
jgi:hypothetical protein